MNVTFLLVGGISRPGPVCLPVTVASREDLVFFGEGGFDGDLHVGKSGDEARPKGKEFPRTANGCQRRVSQTEDTCFRVHQFEDGALDLSVPNLVEPAIDQDFVGGGHGDRLYRATEKISIRMCGP